MNIGDEICARPKSGEMYGETRRGRVVYIHPEDRYYTLEFSFIRVDGITGREYSVRFRESYILPPKEMADIREDRTKNWGALGQSERPRRRKYAEFL